MDSPTPPPARPSVAPCPFCGQHLKHVSPREGDNYYVHDRDECVLGGAPFADPIVIFDDGENVARWNRREVTLLAGGGGEAVAHDFGKDFVEHFHPEYGQGYFCTADVLAAIASHVAAPLRPQIDTAVPGRGWQSVDLHGLPKYEPGVTYVGINTAGYAACFSIADEAGQCWSHTGEESICVMSELEFYRVLERPAAGGEMVK